MLNYIITGELKNVRFHSEENGYTVANFKFEEGEGIDLTKQKPEWLDFMDCFNAVFFMPKPKPGMRLRLEGVEVVNPKFGRQIQCNKVSEIIPTTTYGIEQFLGSGIIRNIGPVVAKNIVNMFGEKTLEVLDNADERLYQVKGVSKTRMHSIISEWGSYKAVREAFIYLEGLNVTPRLAGKIYKKYQVNTIAEVRSNPYQLIEDIEGVGFATADSIALKIGFALDSSERIQAAIIFTLENAGENGHCYLPQDNLANTVAQLIKMHPDRIKQEYDTLICANRIKEENGNIYCRRFFFAENNVARKLLALYNNKENEVIMDLNDEEMQDLENRNGMQYGEKQREAIRTAMHSRVMLLTGGPGTGKTTVLKAIIDLFRKKRFEITACAPTGKAAERMSEATGVEAMTIHRTLGFQADGTFSCNAESPLDSDVTIVDESSMIEITLMSHLMNAITKNQRLILVGDVDQLPCIGPGNILRDIIASGTIPVVFLDTIFRQAEDSQIITNAHLINRGETPVIDNKNNKDFFFIPETNPLKIQNTIVELMKTRLPKAYGYKSDDIQVLCPMKKGDTGTEMLNYVIQSSLNNNVEFIKRGNTVYKKEDRVVQTVNNYDKGVFNGDSGVILGFSTNEDKEKVANVRFKGGRIIKYTQAEFNELILAYALTIHKSQGSEFPVVIIPVTSQHRIMLERNLLYTGITRAKQLCILIGSKPEIEYAARNFVVYKRYTALAEKLQK